MVITIFYFSGTGNTWWTSSVLKKELEQSGNTIDMYSLENPLLKNDEFVLQKIKEADHIIIGYPVHGSGLPGNMQNFIDNLPTVSGNKKFSSFCTQASSSENGNIFFKKDNKHSRENSKRRIIFRRNKILSEVARGHSKIHI